MTADELAGAQVLADVTARRWWQLSKAQRDELAAWLRANGVEPDDVLVDPGLVVVLLDAPVIVRDEVIRSESGHAQWGPDGVLRRRVHSLCRVPLPDHHGGPAVTPPPEDERTRRVDQLTNRLIGCWAALLGVYLAGWVDGWPAAIGAAVTGIYTEWQLGRVYR